MLTGDNGILKKATDAKIKTELAQVREIANIAYLNYTAGQNYENNEKKLDQVIEEELDSSGYPVTKITVDGAKINGVSLKDGNNDISTLNLKTTSTAKNLTVSLNTTEEEESSRYFVLIDGKYNEMFITDDGVTISNEKLITVPSGKLAYAISLTEKGLTGLVKVNGTLVNEATEVKAGDIVTIEPSADAVSGNISLSVTGIDEQTNLAVAIKLDITNGLVVNNYNKGKDSSNNDIVWEILYIGKIGEEDENKDEHVYLISKEAAKRRKFQ